MSLPAPTIVIFDMDGTTVRHLNPLVLHVLEKMDDAAFRISKFFGWLFRRGAKGPIILPAEEEEHKRKPRLIVHRVIHKFRRKPVEQIVEPCPGIYSVLGLLARHGIPMGLASNGLGKGYGHDILEKFGLAQFFKATIFREDIRKSKPNPEALLLALARMGVEPGAEDTIWYIGDRHKDITAALAARAHLPCGVVPLAYGLNASVAVIEKGLSAEHIVVSYHDLHRQLSKLLSPAAQAA